MACKTMILGASYGSLLSSKLAAAIHNVTLVCRQKTADLINAKGTEVRIKLRGKDTHRSFSPLPLAAKRKPSLPSRHNHKNTI